MEQRLDWRDFSGREILRSSALSLWTKKETLLEAEEIRRSRTLENVVMDFGYRYLDDVDTISPVTISVNKHHMRKDKPEASIQWETDLKKFLPLGYG